MPRLLTRFSLVIIFIFSICFSGYTYTLFNSDSLIKVTGYVYDSTLKTPIGGAKLSYEELPYGNLIGIISTDKTSGYFEFLTFGHEQYRVEVKKENYTTVVEVINPLANSRNGIYEKDFRISKLPDIGDVLKLENLIFAQGKSDITPDSYGELDNLAKMMKNKPTLVIQLEGHTDFRGSRTKNMQLSEDRVKAVKNYLKKKGIDSERIFTKAFGGTKPVTRESSEEGAGLNRRVEVRILQR